MIDASDSPALKTVTEWCMSVLGACEIAAVDLGMDKPHTVMAAFWWGNADVLQAVLDGIAELPSRQHVTLDLRAPKALVPAEDAMLTDSFGHVSTSDAFAAEIRVVLKKRADELKGLSLSGAEEALYQLGYVRAGAGPQMVPVAVPGDYAAFSVLGR